ncbi:hypothetical protein Pflav_085790 [Phytohabitans flavus]|uniref:Phosphate acyltransferase n=1 Tax=Phytohabitans flavus TaxID=1076124 RepID=A0A6F8Y813_9ACTN|nr:hypothetical protein Pflav_085790 [Phytohabitans flavus]
MIAAQPLPSEARYVGLVEGYEVSLGERADVIVADGFTGNVLLKGIEGTYIRCRRDQVETPPRAAALVGVGASSSSAMAPRPGRTSPRASLSPHICIAAPRPPRSPRC